MGITGLLPFLKKIHTPVNISQFQGTTVAVDAYCWLHKGAFSCAEKLALGEKTEQYVFYCMKYIEYMQKQDLKVIMVFDGCHLQSKAGVEKTRRERREANKKKAAQFLREGKRSEARECLQRCIDITPQMALDLMKACRARGVDCIVAPYEADAQLAYLNNSGIAQIIVTEDSDLLLFGCEKIIFKMDFHGNGTLIEKSRLNEVMGVQTDFYTFDKFRFMCILSGCDYLPSISGIGLAKANKVFKLARQGDIRQLLKKLPTYLKMNLVVSNDYVDGFVRANNTFLHQLVFDPLTRHLRPLMPLPPELNGVNLDYAGKHLPQVLAYQIALGNIDIHTKETIGYFDPDKQNIHNAPVSSRSSHRLSIWDKRYRPGLANSPCKAIHTTENTSCNDRKTSSTRNDKTISTDGLKKMLAKRNKEIEKPPLTNKEVASLYTCEDDGDDIKRARKNLMESENGFSSLADFGDSDEANRNQTNTSSLSSSEENNECDEQPASFETDRQTFQYTAANIGEETFKRESDQSVKENKETPRKTKQRNIFAVSKSNVKKRDEGAINVEVKSWYFSSSKESSQSATNPSPMKTVPDTKDVLSPSPKRAMKSKRTTLSIRSMFEKAGERNKRVSIIEEKPLESPPSQSMESASANGNDRKSVTSNGFTQDNIAKSAERSNRLGGSNSVYSDKKESKNKMFSRLSAFSWSKLNSADKNRILNEEGRRATSKERHPSENYSSEGLSKNLIEKINDLKRKSSCGSHYSLMEPPAKMNKTLSASSSYFAKPGLSQGSSSEDSQQEIQELEYQSYEGFLKSVSDDSPYTKLLEEPKESKKVSERPSVQKTVDALKSRSFKIETEGVIDLTRDLQTIAKPACRVSGLSRKKGKQKNLDSQQLKIQTFFSKYSFEKKKTPQVKSFNSEPDPLHDPEADEDLTCTPVTILPHSSLVKRKLSL